MRHEHSAVLVVAPGATLPVADSVAAVFKKTWN
jgi:hypothetical protein